MKNRIAIPLMTLVLCMSAFFMPLTAYAASDSTAPDCDAWLSGDTLHIEAEDDDSGVDAVYVDGQRINYLVNGAVDVKLKDYAGTAEKVSVYAVDFAGNQSPTVEIKNPYYVKPASSAPEPTPTPAPTAPSTTPPTSSSQSNSGASSSTSRPSTSTPAASSGSSGTSGSESAIPDSNPLTPEGQASVVDNATEDEGKEFFTFETPEGNVFYLVVDRQREGENVYFLNAVTENDLLALAESDGSTPGESAIPTPEPEPAPQPTPDPDPEPEAEPEKEGGGIGTILLIVLAIAGVGGAGYYFKIVKPKQQAALDDDDDFEDDEDGEGLDMDFAGEDEYLPEDDGYGDFSDEMEDSADEAEQE